MIKGRVQQESPTGAGRSYMMSVGRHTEIRSFFPFLLFLVYKLVHLHKCIHARERPGALPRRSAESETETGGPLVYSYVGTRTPPKSSIGRERVVIGIPLPAIFGDLLGGWVMYPSASLKSTYLVVVVASSSTRPWTRGGGTALTYF